MWRSPLHTELEAAGAVFRTYGELELAESFGGGVLEEYKAVRMAAGLIDLSYRTKLRMTGSDRLTFLQGMLSNDVASLAAGEGCHATFLTVQGRVVADLRLYLMPDHALLDAEPAAGRGLLEGLERHIIADDVELTDVTREYVTLSIQGTRADEVLRAVLGDIPALANEYDHVEARVADDSVRLARVREAGELGYELLAPVEAGARVWRFVLERGVPASLRPVGRAAFNILRVEAGIPWYGIDMDESRIVLEVGLGDAISTTKGCYLGQEVVERASTRGHMNRALTGLRFQGHAVPPSGALVHADGKDVGVVTSGVDSPALGRGIAMAYVRREFLAPGTSLTVSAPDGPVAAEVTTLPFYGR